MSKTGDDANDGTNPALAKLTFGAASTAADALITAGADAVRILVLDGGTYSNSSLRLSENVHLTAPAATFVGLVRIDANASFHIDKHYPAAGSTDVMVRHDGGSAGAAIYSCNISDGRGVDGLKTGARNVVNNGGGGRNLFVRVGIMYVSQDGVGVGDVSGTDAGHIHILIPDVYLAGNNAIGIEGTGLGSNTSNIIGVIDHILEIGGPTATTGIRLDDADAIVKLTVSEIIADTAYNIVAGDLYLSCPKITGARVGTPANLMLGTIDFPTTDQLDGVTVWNDGGVLKVST